MTAIAATCVAIGLIAYMLTASNGSPAVAQNATSTRDKDVEERLPRSVLPSEYR